MKKFLKQGLSLVLALVMVAGLLPVTAFAAVDSSGKPTDLNNTLVLSLYTGSGFPGEPAVYGTSNYKNINSSFAVRSGATFASSAANQLDWEKIKKDLVQGASSGNTSVWGVYDANGTKDYFLPGASIIDRDNEIKMICAAKNCTEAEAEKYEIVWYVIKLQHNPGSGWFSRATTEWHIDGVIKEKAKISINYYGNGNTSGNAPLGTTSHTAGDPYTVLDKNTMVKKINGVEVSFLGWSAKADGTGAEAGFYQPGDVISPTESISLYAMWDTFTQYTATVNTYLDGVLTDDSDIHGADRDLYLSTDEEHYYQLTRDNEGVYTVKITGNGKFHLYHKNADGTYTQIGTHQLTIYNQNGSLDVHHYNVTYDANGGEFAANPGKQAFMYGEAVTAVTDEPTKEGYRFLGWKDNSGKPILPGESVTASIDRPITLTAQWEKTVNVTIHVTINHKGGNGYDQMETKDDVFLALVSRANSDSPYLETGDTLTLNETNHEGFEHDEEANVTVYTAEGVTYTDMPGGEVEYTVVTSKSGYDTTVTPKQDADGNWIIDVVMTYNPTNFDLAFTVEVDENVPEQYVPNAAIVKVTFWSTDRNQWEIITQQEGNLPGVRVDIDPDTRSGSGSYPVWKYESAGSNPYGYRIQVTSFVYPDGTIVPASQVVTQDVAWTDNVYKATMDSVTGGQTYGTKDGAYFDDNSNAQKGTLNAVITMDLHDVIFDAKGGKVNGQASQTVEKQYKIPAFKNYVPTREGGYTFGGWYEDAACTKTATEGMDLTKDIILYAKWIKPLTISGTVTISGTYMQDGKKVSVHDIDRATEAVVVLQEIRNGSTYDVDSANVSFGSYQDAGSADYSFSGIPNDGKLYQIHVLVLNYSTAYDNESDSNSEYTSTEYTAVFGSDNVAEVDAYLEFEAPAYNQKMNVDATQISENFRPTDVLSEVMYRDTGDNHPFQRISQHGVTPFGVKIELDTGKGSGSESIWKWHTNGALYDYQMNISKLYGNVPGVFSSEGTEFNSDTAPYYIIYDAPVYWDASSNSPSGEMQATLVPKQYLISFDLNADGDTVTGMDGFKLSYKDEAGEEVATDIYGVLHTWSFDTAITAVPQREGYIFKGWKADVETAYVDGKIPAGVYENVVLTAQWSRDCFTVTTVTTTGGNTTGDGIYDNGETATVTATPDEGYIFKGWYENGQLVSNDASYSFTVTENRTLTAKFAACCTVTTNAQKGGSVSGGGAYETNATATITAEANAGYYFIGWYDENGEMVTAYATYTLTVLRDRTFTARFEKKVSYKCDYVYLFGYNDTEIGADGPLLRGELLQMIYRLVKQNDGSVTNGGNSFEDTAGRWFESGVSYMASIGAIDATKTRAYPEAPVSRGETYKMICLGLGFTNDASLNYSEYAAILRNSGYLTDDGRVTAKIQRWEFCQLFNAILGRSNYCLNGFYDVNGNEVTAETYGYTDLSDSDYYYRIMMIATSTFTGEKIDLEKRMDRNTYDYTN